MFQLANLMKGSITLESTPNVGSKAAFTVPLKVSSWCLNPRFDTSASSPPHPGFHFSNISSKTPTWTQPLANCSINQDLLNQQISNSVKNYQPVQPPPIERSLRQGSIGTISNIPLTLSPEQRSRTHVLVVEDKYVPSHAPLPYLWPT
jgi:hypothetical protein